MERYIKFFNEEDYQQIEIGDEVLGGKFRNKRMIVKDFDVDEKNQPIIKTDKGEKKLYTVRIKQEERYEKFFKENFNLEKFLLKWTIEGGINLPNVYIKYLIKNYPNILYNDIGFRLLRNIVDDTISFSKSKKLDIDGFPLSYINKQKLNNNINALKHKYQSFSKSTNGIINTVRRGLITLENSIDVIGIKAKIYGIDLTKLVPYLKDKNLISFIEDMEELIGIFDKFETLGFLSRDSRDLFIPIDYTKS